LMPIRLSECHHYWNSSFWSNYSTANELILNFDRLIVLLAYNKISTYIDNYLGELFYAINTATTKL